MLRIWTWRLVCLLALAQSSAMAQSEALQKIDSLQRQLDQLRAESSTRQEFPVWYQASPSDAVAGTNISQPASPMPEVPLSYIQAPSPKIESKASLAEMGQSKTYPDFKVTGFFHLDSAYFGQSVESQAIVGDIQDGTGFRRARLAATGNFSERGSYIMEFDMAQGQPRFVDVWGQIKDTPLGTMRIGRFRQPFGMSELTSIRELPFLERPLTFALATFRQTGVMFSDTAFDESLTWAVSGYRHLSDNFGNVYGDNGGYGTAARLTVLPVDGGDSRIIHLGLDHGFADPGRDQILIASQDEISLSQQPNLGSTSLSVLPIVFVPAFVNSGILDIDYGNAFNVEAAASCGRALIQSEYRWSRLDLQSGDEATVHSGYATVRYVLTGETIPYNRTAGVFGRIKPRCPIDVAQGHWGAWEIAARVSTINLNPLFGLTGVTGPTRRLKSFDLGLNWYWWDNAKVQMQWVNGSLNDPVVGDGVSNTAAARFQVDF